MQPRTVKKFFKWERGIKFWYYTCEIVKKVAKKVALNPPASSLFKCRSQLFLRSVKTPREILNMGGFQRGVVPNVVFLRGNRQIFQNFSGCCQVDRLGDMYSGFSGPVDFLK